MILVGMAANVVPDPEGSGDQDHANERENRTTHNSRIRHPHSGVKAWDTRHLSIRPSRS